MQPIPMMATGTGGEGADEFKSLPFRASRCQAGDASRIGRAASMKVLC